MTGPLPQSMRYIDMAGPGGSEVLTLATGPVPRPGPQEVLIRVTAAGVNRPDVLQRTGSYPPPPGASPVLGLEVAGTIAALGPEVTEWREDDSVWYEILAFSRPAHIFTKIGYPLARRMQRRFANDSKAAMVRAAHQSRM